MKVYIAAPWADKALMPDIGEKFEAAGHKITHKWWDVDSTPENLPGTALILRQQAINDIQGVQNADLVVVMNTAKSEGKSFEQGIATADNKPIVIVGQRGSVSMNVFHYLDNYRWVENLSDALEVLDTIEWLTHHEGV